jgi:endonuclease/exonuclease/phosphatase family metal-dependent hydrolase
MDRVRLLTINIWNQMGPWPERLAVLRQQLAAESADIVAMQEVLRMQQGGLSQLDEVGEGLYPHRAYVGPYVLDAETGFTFGNAVLSRLPFVEEESFVLPNPLQLQPRGLLYVLCATPHGQLPIFCTHLDWQLELSHLRCGQVSFIVEKMTEILARAEKRPGADILPAVLMGDFNAEPDSDEIRFLRGRHALPAPGGGPLRGVFFQDCFTYCGGDDKTGVTFAKSNRYAAIAREPDRRIDYIFSALPDRLMRCEPLSASRCLDKPVDGVFASDHYGVTAELRLAPV